MAIAAFQAAIKKTDLVRVNVRVSCPEGRQLHEETVPIGWTEHAVLVIKANLVLH